MKKTIILTSDSPENFENVVQWVRGSFNLPAHYHVLLAAFSQSQWPVADVTEDPDYWNVIQPVADTLEDGIDSLKFVSQEDGSLTITAVNSNDAIQEDKDNSFAYLTGVETEDAIKAHVDELIGEETEVEVEEV